MDPWDHVLPGRGRPLHHVHDPFYGRTRGSHDRTLQEPASSSAPPSEGHPAVAAFRASKFPATPTTFYTYDGRIASTLNSAHGESSSRQYDSRSSSRNTSSQGHKGRSQGLKIGHQGHKAGQQDQSQLKKTGRDGRTYYYGRQNSNQSYDSNALRDQGATPKTPNKQQLYRKRERSGDSSFQWHSTPIRQSYRDPRPRKPSLPRTNSSFRRSSLDSPPSPSGKESLSWAGVEPYWRKDNSSDLSSKRRSGSYDELESRYRRRYDSTGDDDGLAVFNWSPNKGPVISIDHHPSST